MVPRNAEGIGCGKFGEAMLLIVPLVHRPGDGRFQEALVADAGRTAKQRQLLGVHRHHIGYGQPTGVSHLANALKVS